MNTKYLLAYSEDISESNIAVITYHNCPTLLNVNKDEVEKNFPVDSLTRALCEHFDSEVTVDSVKMLSAHPLVLTASCNEDGNVDFVVRLEETWVY